MSYDYTEHDKIWNDGDWFNRLRGVCQFTGKPVGHADGKYHPWARHHTSSQVYSGKEKLRPGKNYILLSKWSHWFVHFLGGQLLLNQGNIRAQNKQARRLPLTSLWRYPNVLQKGFHSWCRLPRLVKIWITFVADVLFCSALCLAAWFVAEAYFVRGVMPLDYLEGLWRALIQ